jgi:type II secretory pathway pseudopilin PulG
MNQREAGLTIVETLIVLAAASLILLIVLLALPALQRNSRNNQRNQDAQIILQAVSGYELNHAGTIPNTLQLRSFLNSYEKNKLTLFEPAGVTVSTPAASAGLTTYPSTPVAIDKFLINNHAKCSGGGKASNQGAGYSDIVALYAIETASGTAPRCQQL